MPARRVLLLSTPIGTLGSGAGGGVELTIAATARALQRRGHHVTVVAPEGSVLDGVPVIGVPGVPPPSAQHLDRDTPVALPAGSVLAGMCATVRERQDHWDVAINYAYDWLPLWTTAWLTKPLLHVVGMGSLLDVVDEAITVALAHRPGGVAVHTRAQAATFPFGDQLRVIGNGLDLDRYRPVLEVAEPRLGWVARISPEKGLDDAIAAAQAVGLPLHVWGFVEDPHHWQAVLDRFGADAVRHHGFLPTDELQAALGTCTAMLATHRWEEAFGNVVAEAQACGVPVVTYDRGGPAELVRDGVTGFVTPPDDVDGLVAALNRIDRIDRAACRRHAEETFSLDALGARVEAWFEGELASGNP